MCREQVVARFGHFDPEYVVPEPGEWLVDTRDRQVIEALVREVTPPRAAAFDREAGRLAAEVLTPAAINLGEVDDHVAAYPAAPAGRGWPPRWFEIERELMRRAMPAALASRLHGPDHWPAVARVGLVLACRTPGADLELVVLFALCHDVQRWTDGADPKHGVRGGQVALDLAGLGNS